ncbi:MAG: hypothetical protein E2O68_09800 [Deltaproteobacteria bacterium]|nr:MAG: hypothetical protein E2O68_09800 [Deltaproteobacteria bacterium]
MKLILLLVFLSSCSSFMTKEDQQVLRNAHRTGQYDKALEYLKNSDNYQRDESKLLLFLETGLIEHSKGNYQKSIADFEKAREVYKTLYTSSFSKNVQSLIANDNYDHFFGATYERSLIHFFLALNHFLLHQDAKLSKSEKRIELFAARAEILSWDSFLSEQIGEKKGRSVFKNDLLARVFGGFVHESVGTREDLEVALQLYKDAGEILFKNYNAYQVYNGLYKKFVKDFDKLHGFKTEQVRNNYVNETSFQKELKEFLNYKVLELSKKKNKRAYKKLVRSLKPSKEILKKLKEKDNITIILQRGIIPEKVAKVEYFPLGTIMASQRYQQQGLYNFASRDLRIGYAPYHYRSYGNNYSFGSALAIKFEVPVIRYRPIREKITVNILDFNGKSLGEEKMVLISPMGEIAEQALAEDAPARYRRIGLRLATKYVTAIAASYATYMGLRQRLGAGLAKAIAVGQFAIASNMIQKSEKADIRYWATLPNDIRLASFYLPPGKYRLRANVKEEEKSFLLGKIEVDDSGQMKLFSYRRFY